MNHTASLVIGWTLKDHERHFLRCEQRQLKSVVCIFPKMCLELEFDYKHMGNMTNNI